MKKRFAALAIMSFLASSFVLAQDVKKSAHPTDNPRKSAAENSQGNDASHSDHPAAKKGAKGKHQPEAPCSCGEQEFDEVLRGIYG